MSWGYTLTSQKVLFPVNKAKYQSTCQCLNIITLPTKCLGLPLGDKSKSVTIWNEVIEKMDKMLASWKQQYISLGGRISLFNSVISALPMYTIFPFLAPSSVLK